MSSTSPTFWAALGAFAVILAGGLDFLLGSRRLRFLRDLPARGPGDLPPVSVIIAARNEARDIADSLLSLRAQEGIQFEILAVNDRSEDGTGDIVSRIAVDDARVRLVEVEKLPDGWLGKNHALQCGAKQARHPWLLFTDADVMMQPNVLARAASFAEEGRLDHLAITPELRMPTLLTDLFAGAFVLFFNRYARPWKARDPRSPAHIGIGAFNLVRASAYRAAGGHTPIRMRPDDDMALGKILKKAGFRQDVLLGTDQIRVTWYRSVREGVHGLEKNAFTALRYSMPAVLASVAALLFFGVWPWVGMLLTSGPAQWLSLAAVLLTVALYVLSTRASGADPRLAPAFPLAVILFCYIILRAALLARFRGEIRWRGRAYPLDELRRNRI